MMVFGAILFELKAANAASNTRFATTNFFHRLAGMPPAVKSCAVPGAVVTKHRGPFLHTAPNGNDNTRFYVMAACRISGVW
jgi:hypothetical protein